eukprot:TRINITY_DN6672_c0_g1_i5.p1 TRINITY_DN6672_c0_g1~~TRINITY_DN6672_c0_g1_i5.p1  ORF type:complete len:487 (-),score=33.75 TRINITY_DN6672_c0_g1_i5:142-1602(-)
MCIRDRYMGLSVFQEGFLNINNILRQFILRNQHNLQEVTEEHLVIEQIIRESARLLDEFDLSAMNMDPRMSAESASVSSTIRNFRDNHMSSIDLTSPSHIQPKSFSPLRTESQDNSLLAPSRGPEVSLNIRLNTSPANNANNKKTQPSSNRSPGVNMDIINRMLPSDSKPISSIDQAVGSVSARSEISENRNHNNLQARPPRVHQVLTTDRESLIAKQNEISEPVMIDYSMFQGASSRKTSAGEVRKSYIAAGYAHLNNEGGVARRNQSHGDISVEQMQKVPTTAGPSYPNTRTQGSSRESIMAAERGSLPNAKGNSLSSNNSYSGRQSAASPINDERRSASPSPPPPSSGGPVFKQRASNFSGGNLQSSSNAGDRRIRDTQVSMSQQDMFEQSSGKVRGGNNENKMPRDNNYSGATNNFTHNSGRTQASKSRDKIRDSHEGEEYGSNTRNTLQKSKKSPFPKKDDLNNDVIQSYRKKFLKNIKKS